jgi:hypothetical protein
LNVRLDNFQILFNDEIRNVPSLFNVSND